MSVVVNGSVTPKVIGSGRFSGSGSLTISRIRWFCQKHSDVVTPSATSAMMIRVRSSSRWSTSVSRSSWSIGLTRGTGRVLLPSCALEP